MNTDNTDFSKDYQHEFSKEALSILESLHNNSDFKFIRNLINDEGMEKKFTRTHGEISRFGYQYYLNEKEKSIKGIVSFGTFIEGPPNCVHGGAIATILDSAMGAVIWNNGHKAVTVNLNVNYKKFIPLESEVVIEVKLNKIEGRKIFVEGQLKSLNEEIIHNDATALFISIEKH
jgi:acyl-coenzyme A thioesterase PaaI-like protein